MSRFVAVVMGINVPVLLCCCGPTGGDRYIQSVTRPQACPGYTKKLMTDAVNHYGINEDQHSVAAELLYSNPLPSNERFAVSWVSPSLDVAIRRYDTATGSFLGGTYPLNNPGLDWQKARGKWVQSVGYDDECPVNLINDNQCAWFSWAGSYGLMYWRAVGATTGNMSPTKWWFGVDPAGDRGAYSDPYSGVIRKRLLAFISPDRRQVWAAFLDRDGNMIAGTEKLLHTTPSSDWEAQQTAVAWSSAEHRWLVVWTDNHKQTYTANGIVYATHVDFFTGSFKKPPTLVMYCEGDGTSSSCPPAGTKAKSAKPNGGVILTNDRCACKVTWVSSSWYSATEDRYRIHQYGKHARLNGDAVRTALYSKDTYPFTPKCGTYCPITEATFSYGDDYTPFQMLRPGTGVVTETVHHRLVLGSRSEYYAGQVMDTYATPQAFRSDGSVAVAVAGSGLELALSIVDVKPGGCPPPP